MIVVDTNVIAYLLLPGNQTAFARSAFQRDPTWVAPLLWRSEFRNVLATGLRQKHFTLRQANDVMIAATDLMSGGEYDVDSTVVLKLARDSGRSAYDCEYVSLAKELRVPLVTQDKLLLQSFPRDTIALSDF